ARLGSEKLEVPSLGACELGRPERRRAHRRRDRVMLEARADDGQEVRRAREWHRKHDLERREMRTSLAERAVEPEEQLDAHRADAAALEARRETIAQGLHDEGNGLDVRSAPLELHALLGDL